MINSAKECEAAYYELGYDNKGIKWDGVVSNPNAIPGCAWLHGAWNVNFNENLQADNNDETGNHGSICRVDGSTDNSDDEPQESSDDDVTEESNGDDDNVEGVCDPKFGNAYKKDNQVACSEADMIDTLEDCIAAFEELKISGFTWHKEYSHADQTPGCRWDSYHMNFAFNSNLAAKNKASP
jgi:hypothetical protein